MSVPSPRALLLNLLATSPGPMPVAALVTAGALFGHSGNVVRVALRRLCEAGPVRRVGRGLYALSEPAQAVNRRVRAWSRPARVRAWDGRWLLLLDAEASAGDSRARRLFGFADARPGLAVRPANLAAGPAELLRELRAVGLASEAELLVGESADPATERAWRGLWSGAALARECTRVAAGLETSLARLPDMSEPDALRESFERGGAAIRRLVYDPLLPDEIAPSAPRERLREAMVRYDAAGRARWGAFMAGFGLGRRGRSLRAAPWEAHDAEGAT